MKIWLAQLNTRVGDIEANVAAIVAACDTARAVGAEVVVTPELAVLGYPPLDLLERRELLAACVAARPTLAAASRGLTLIAGTALPAPPDAAGRQLRPAINAADVFADGVWRCTIAKRLLPTYDVFDEDRYFLPGDESPVLEIAGRRVGVTICEDIWSEDETGPRRYECDPVAELALAGAEIVLNLSASPFDLGKAGRRRRLLEGVARRNSVAIAYCNLVGGNDSLIFDGRSMVFAADGALLAQLAAFAVDGALVTLPGAGASALGGATAGPAPVTTEASEADEARAALTLGMADYLRKCGFREVLLGLSGGIDSAVTAALAVEALGPDAVLGVAMPSALSSDHSVRDALALAHNLGIRCPVIPISDIVASFQAAIAAERALPGRDRAGVTDQNLQARARGTVLMALSNYTGRLLLTTGNKSELAVGYCTLYGDMNGGLAVIGDLPKMLVCDVARSINRERELIPRSTLDKPPSAELAPDQRDDDTLPPYPVLDRILALHVVANLPADEIAARTGDDLALVRHIVRLVELNEFKRRQAAPTLRVTQKAFGGGRRIPVARRLPD